MHNSLIHGSFPGRKQTPRRRSARLDVFKLEDRTLMSTALAPGTSHDAFLAATARVKESGPAIRANSPPHQLVRPLPSIPPLARLGYYLTTNIDHEKNFVPHFVQLDQEPFLSAVDAKLQNPDTDVYVLVHGYAPGFETWVRNYDPVDLTTISKTPGASTTKNSVTLTQQDNSSSQSYIGSFQTAHKWSAGLTFNYNFTNYVQGDMLNIYDKTPGGQYELAFVIDPNQVPAQTDALQGTISLGSRSIATYDLKFALTSTTPNSTSSVTVSNLMQYANPGTKNPSGVHGKRR